MNPAFLLRFQEECLPHDTSRDHSADPTVTEIKAEQPDDDALGCSRTFLSVPGSAADPTHTLIKAEAPDESAEAGMTALPFRKSSVCPTSTCTRTLAETNDTDLGHTSIHAIPKCF